MPRPYEPALPGASNPTLPGRCGACGDCMTGMDWIGCSEPCNPPPPPFAWMLSGSVEKEGAGGPAPLTLARLLKPWTGRGEMRKSEKRLVVKAPVSRKLGEGRAREGSPWFWPA